MNDSSWPVELRPQGLARYLGAAFLAFWLCGWAAGEVFALTALVAGAAALLGGGSVGFLPKIESAPLALLGGAFLLFWLTFWTLGGVAAIHELLRSLWGLDRIAVDGIELRLESHAGPFCSTRRWPRDAVRRLILRARDHALVLESAHGTTVLTKWGSEPERRELRDRLRAALVIDASNEDPARDEAAPPPSWEAGVDADGSTVLRRSVSARRAAARVCALIALVPVAGAAGVIRDLVEHGISPGRAVGLGVLALAAAVLGTLAAWLLRGDFLFRIRQGGLERVLRFAGREWVRRLEGSKLAVERSVDSDGDEFFRLAVRDGSRRQVIASAMNESREVLHLGRWLAARSGLPFETAPEVLAQE